MADQTQTDGQVVIDSTPLAGPGVYYSVPAAAAAPQTLYVSQHQKTASGKYGASLDRVTSIWLGALLICSGVTSFVGAAFAFRYNAYYSELGTGLWCGSMVSYNNSTYSISAPNVFFSSLLVHFAIKFLPGGL